MSAGVPTKDALRKIANKEFASAEERDQLLQQLGAATGLGARDVIWMLFRPDRALREGGARALAKARDPETLDAFLVEAKGKADAALRAAAAALYAAQVPGMERRFAELLVPVAKPSADVREMQELARKTLAEVPPQRAFEPLLWELEANSPDDARLRVLEKLARLDLHPQSLARWQKLATHESKSVREMALGVLATRAAGASIAILARQLPSVSYSTQQTIVDALTSASAERADAILDALLPLLASGDAAVRTAVVKVLVQMPDRVGTIRRYIEFSRSLAGFVRDRAIDALRAFGSDLIEPLNELLADPDGDVRAAAIGIAALFNDKRLVPPTIRLLNDSDWWVRIAAADTLGTLKDPRAVEPLLAALADADGRWAAIDALARIGDPRALAPIGKFLNDPEPEFRIAVIQALALFKHPQVVDAIVSVATRDPERTVRSRAMELVEEVAAREKRALDLPSLRNTALSARAGQSEPKLHAMLVATRNQGGSDFHLAVQQPPIVRVAADLLRAQGTPFTAEQTESMIREILTPVQWERLEREKQLDFCYTLPQGGRYRANVFLDHVGYHAVFRVIPEYPPTIAEIGLPAHLAEIADHHQGLVLICGPSGSGKSTTLAALVNLFNETREHHIITMEDPVEFVHPFKTCLINQREIGTHSGSYARALRAALREDPDVIVIGELRDNESVALALLAAETGHIVLATISSTSAPKAIDRIISSFTPDEQGQVRASMSESLRYVIAQRLLPSKTARRRVAAFEVLRGTSTVANLIRDEKTYQIYSAMQIGKSQGMVTLDEALKDLLRRDQISPETAYLAALKKEDFEEFVPAAFLEQAGS
jgi:twitching motility protein PilT